MFWLHAAAACTAVVVSGCRALPFFPRDPPGRHPCVDCTVRNPGVVDCRENEVSQALSLRCPDNYDLAGFI